MKLARHHISAKERAKQNESIVRRVLNESVFQKADTVFCYCATEEEIDTYPILQQALMQKKRLCLPRTLGQGQMEACQIVGLHSLKRSPYGILEPDSSCPAVCPEQIDLCIIPCLAADYHGHRLGYGGGYYDRFLPRTHAVRLVLCAQSRLFPEIPSQEHDAACDIILTESQVIRLHEK